MESERRTYCRICEPLCGLVVSVEDGEITKIRADKEHPMSRGMACPKGIAMKDVVNDPDRVTSPLRRRAGVPRGSGGVEQFERVSWEEAMSDIAERMQRVLAEHGGSGVGCYFGNPAYLSYSAPMWGKGLMDALGSPHYFSAASQDLSNRMAASALMYGSPLEVPIPDIRRTRFLLVLGANPLVSHGSLMATPRIEEKLRGIADRGRVVVIDPRRTKTAEAFEHIPIVPDTDVWLLLSMLQVIFAESLQDDDAIADQTTGIEAVRAMAAEHSPEATEARTRVPAATVRELARALATAESAAVYGRVGVCRSTHATLNAFLMDVLTIVTGNFDRPGGLFLGTSPLPAKLMDAHTSYASALGRTSGLPEVFGSFPSAAMAKEMTTPGPGQLRAFLTIGGNPVLSVPNGLELEAAMTGLDLHVAIDLYVSETGSYADYILPATTFLEREDVPLAMLAWEVTPFLEWTEAVVEPRGEARQEWEILEDLARRLGVVASSAPALRRLGKFGIRLTPQQIVDLGLRLGPRGDLFGLRRGGLNLKKLRAMSHGIKLAEYHPTGVLAAKVRLPGGRARLDAPEIVAEARSVGSRHSDDEAFPLRLIGVRELRSHNSWMHNVSKLMVGRDAPTVRIHPDDAAAQGIEHGAPVTVRSATGVVELPAQVTDEMITGAVAIPHGWGHHLGNWKTARERPGVNFNHLASSRPEDLERLAGMSHLDGIPVSVAPGERPAAYRM